MQQVGQVLAQHRKPWKTALQHLYDLYNIHIKVMGMNLNDEWEIVKCDWAYAAYQTQENDVGHTTGYVGLRTAWVLHEWSCPVGKNDAQAYRLEWFLLLDDGCRNITPWFDLDFPVHKHIFPSSVPDLRLQHNHRYTSICEDCDV